MSHFAPQRRSTRTATFSATLAAAAIALTACGADADPSGPTSAPAPAADGAESPSGEARAASSVSEGDRVDPTRTTEVSAVTPRILLSHEGGLTLLDAESGEVVREQDVPGFTRLSNAGNGKDVLVTTGNGWEVFSTGIQTKAHGDHVHHYESAPGMTGVTFPGEHPGHVVTHNGRTTLFGDGTGAIRTFDSAHLDKATPDLMPVMTEVETDDCHGSHGEAAAQPTEAGDVVVMGCENGPVVYRDGEFHKVDVETEYQRSGNLFGLHDSPIVLGDHKVEEEPEEAVERPTAIALIDTRTDELTTVDLGSSYWFRSLGRAEDGSAVVLTYDGEVTVIDEETGEVTAEYPVIEPWKEKDEWQEPGPILKVAGNTAYVTDAEAQKLVAVDLETGETVLEKDLEFAPVEMAVVTGQPESVKPEEGAHGDEDHDDDGHEGHDHGAEPSEGHEGHDH